MNGSNNISQTFLSGNQSIVTSNQPSHKYTDKALNYSVNTHFFVNGDHVIHCKQSYDGIHHFNVLTDDVKLHRRRRCDKSTKLSPFAYFQTTGEFKWEDYDIISTVKTTEYLNSAGTRNRGVFTEIMTSLFGFMCLDFMEMWRSDIIAIGFVKELW